MENDSIEAVVTMRRSLAVAVLCFCAGGGVRGFSLLPATSRRRLWCSGAATSSEEEDFRNEEFWSNAEEVDCCDDNELKSLYERVSKTRSALELADKTCVENWRKGAMDQTAVVHLEDARVSQARLFGETCAFGTSTGAVLVIDLAEGDIIDGYEGHVGEVTALDWDGARLLTGGTDGIVRVFQPQTHRDSLFELIDDDFGDMEAEDLLEGSEMRPSASSSRLDDDDDEDDFLSFERSAKGDAEAAALARAPLYRTLCSEFEPKDRLADEAIVVFGGFPSLTAQGEGEEEEEESIALHGHSSRVTGVRVCDGVVYSCSLDKQILAWDLVSRKGRLVATTESAVCCLAIVGTLAVVGLLNGGIAAYDLDSGDLVFSVPKAHEGAVRAIDLSRRRERPSSLGVDDDDSSVSLDGTLLVTGGMDGVVKCYTIRTHDDGTVTPVAPNSGDEDDEAPGEESESRSRRRRQDGRLGAHTLRGHSGAVVAVQADDTKLVSAANDGSVRVWCLRSGRQLYAIQGLSRKISSVHFDKHLLVCDGTDESIVVHDFSDPKASSKIEDEKDDDDSA